MSQRIPMTRRSLSVAAAMFAAAAATLAFIVLIDIPTVGSWGASIVAMAALPLAGVSIMLGRSWIDTCAVLAVAIVVGGAMFLSSIS